MNERPGAYSLFSPLRGHLFEGGAFSSFYGIYVSRKAVTKISVGTLHCWLLIWPGDSNRANFKGTIACPISTCLFYMSCIPPPTPGNICTIKINSINSEKSRKNLLSKIEIFSRSNNNKFSEKNWPYHTDSGQKRPKCWTMNLTFCVFESGKFWCDKHQFWPIF